MNKNEFDIDKVMRYFYEISKIPRMSGKENKIADYIECFAQKRNFTYIRDEYNNIIIIKEATKWNTSNESIMLQCHLDMVCEKEEYSNHNFEKDGLSLYIDGDFIKAKDTTLGADNGIGIAIILSILDSNNINHPRIEAIFTTQEETTMEGAKKIDTSSLKGKKMICLDNMNEEELWIGCASAKIFQYSIEGKKEKNSNDIFIPIKIGINGFLGGHSGKDISKNRGNPIKEMGNILKLLDEKYEIFLSNIYGGRKVNVIPRECYSEIYIRNEDFAKIKQEIVTFNKMLINKLSKDNNKIKVTIEKVSQECNEHFDSQTTKNIITIINSMKNGVYYKDKYSNPLISLNIGKIEKIDNKIELYFSIRSNRSEIEKKLEQELENNIIKKFNIQMEKSELSGYEHKKKSDFIDECKIIYKKHFEREPKIIDMHICLEAGFFGSKINDLDFIAIAPNIYDAHSPKERCSISSLKKVYNYIILILKKL